jgi:hypothetical protein
MSWWQKTGYPVGSTRHKIAAYVSVDITNPEEIRQAINLGGGVLFGLQMPIAAQTMTGVWTAPPAELTGNWASGSWGGHCTDGLMYTENGYGLVSWGEWFFMENGFASAFLDETYMAVSTDWFGPDGNAPIGFDIEQLTADLAAL